MEQFSQTSNTADVQAEESEFQTSAPCANLIKMTTVSLYFDELEHNLTENDQKQHTRGTRKRNIQVMLQEISS